MTNRGPPVFSRYFYSYYLKTLGKNGKDSFAYNDENCAWQSRVPLTPAGEKSQSGCERTGGRTFQMTR